MIDKQLLSRAHRELLDVLNSINQDKIHYDGDAFHELLNDIEEALADHHMREVQRLGQEIEQEPVCPSCKAKVLYECVACSSNNYPPPQRTEPIQSLQCFHCQDTIETLNGKVMHLLAKRKPLTEEQIWKAIRPLATTDQLCKKLIDISMDEYRAIEVAHGIKENT